MSALATRRIAAVPTLVIGALTIGCTGTQRPVIEVLPVGNQASPWRLQDPAWTGTFAEAVSSLGADADAWRTHEPTRVWLAVYCHEEKPARCLTVRVFAFESRDRAMQAFEAFRPPDAVAFAAGEAGCWTQIGVLFQWGRLVFDIFGQDTSWYSQVQSSLLASYIVNRMPPGIADDPR